MLGEPPSAEGALVPYHLPKGPLEWPSCDEGSDARSMLNDFREDKVWQHVGRQGLEAQEVLACRISLLLEEVERAEKLVTSGLHPAVGVSSFTLSLFSPARGCFVVTSFLQVLENISKRKSSFLQGEYGREMASEAAPGNFLSGCALWRLCVLLILRSIVATLRPWRPSLRENGPVVSVQRPT